ncbi:hypothetical protein [Burkholderia ubonensis]|uniref:hypothetical protein n=1 Tax=Burkholderia ubonensis TaxID=101571 RepID=UPI000B115932|nr:hypothetical protein [Burkholderia ubonensis]
MTLEIGRPRAASLPILGGGAAGGSFPVLNVGNTSAAFPSPSSLPTGPERRWELVGDLHGVGAPSDGSKATDRMSDRAMQGMGRVRPPDYSQRWNDWELQQACDYLNGQLGGSSIKPSGDVVQGNNFGDLLASPHLKSLGRTQLKDLALSIFVASDRGVKPLSSAVKSDLEGFVSYARAALKTFQFKDGFHQGRCAERFMAINDAVSEIYKNDVNSIFERYRGVVAEDVIKNIVKKDSRVPAGEWKFEHEAWDLACRQFKNRIADEAVSRATIALDHGDNPDIKISVIAGALRLIGSLEDHVRQLSSKAKDNSDSSAREELSTPPFRTDSPSIDGGKRNGPFGTDSTGTHFSQWKDNFSPKFENSPKFEVRIDGAIEKVMEPVSKVIDLLKEVLDDVRSLRGDGSPLGANSKRFEWQARHVDVLDARDGANHFAPTALDAETEGDSKSTVDGDRVPAPAPPPLPRDEGARLKRRVSARGQGRAPEKALTAFGVMQVTKGKLADERGAQRVAERPSALEKSEGRRLSDKPSSDAKEDDIEQNDGSTETSRSRVKPEDATSSAGRPSAAVQGNWPEVKIPKMAVLTQSAFRGGTSSSATSAPASS